MATQRKYRRNVPDSGQVRGFKGTFVPVPRRDSTDPKTDVEFYRAFTFSQFGVDLPRLAEGGLVNTAEDHTIFSRDEGAKGVLLASFERNGARYAAVVEAFKQAYVDQGYTTEHCVDPRAGIAGLKFSKHREGSF